VRAGLNRLVVAAVLLVALPCVALAGWVRPRSAAGVARWWVLLAARLTGLRFEQRGRLESRPSVPLMLAANHSSPADIAALLAVVPGLSFVAGADLFKIPLLGAAMRALRTVPVDRRSRNGAHLNLPDGFQAQPRSLAVFPEGGIAPSGTRLPFRRGAFALAIQTGAEVVPVALHGAGRVLPPRARLRVRPGAVVVEFLPALRTDGLDLEDRRRLAERAEQAVLGALGPEDGGQHAGSCS
jgi:1-acyl-sn-glycerol-3-phosphate acyltransferase